MRPTRDDTNMAIALAVAKRTTCARRAVGAVATDADGYVLGTGYNGQYAGSKHCNEGNPCSGATSPSGTNIDGCSAIHAEQNLLLHCGDPRKIDTVYVTTSPCLSCLKLLLGTNTKRIVFKEKYAGSETSAQLWTDSGRIWEHYKEEEEIVKASTLEKEKFCDSNCVWTDHHPDCAIGKL